MCNRSAVALINTEDYKFLVDKLANLGLECLQFYAILKYWKLIKRIGAAVFLLSTNLLSHMACRKYDKPWKYDLETQRNTNDNILEIQLVGVGLIKGIGAAVFLLSSNLLSCSPLPLLGEV